MAVYDEAPKIKQIEAILNPSTNKIHLFGVTRDDKVVSYSAADGKWSDIDQSEAGYVD